MSLRPLRLLSLALLLSGACVCTPAAWSPEGKPCDESGRCLPGYVCSNGLCVLPAGGDNGERDAAVPDGGPPDAGPRDGGGDAGIDGGADAGTDAGADAGTDAGADGGNGGTMDGGPDGGSGCIDNDGDHTYVGEGCSPLDCDDDRADCGADCSTCRPVSFTVDAPTSGAACQPQTIVVTTGYPDQGARIACRASPVRIDGPATFETATFEGWSTGYHPDIELEYWRNRFPSTCPDAGIFVRWRNSRGAELVRSVDVGRFGGIELRGLFGYRQDPPAGDNLAVWADCAGNPTTKTYLLNEASGGSDDCRTERIRLPHSMDGCTSLTLHIAWEGSDLLNCVGPACDRAGADDLAVYGSPLLSPVTDRGDGTYEVSVELCRAATFDVTCTWDDGTDNPPRDSATVVFR